MYKIKETIIVEGIYDKIKLARFIDGIIIVCGGFAVFSDKKLIETIKTLADKTGVVILTDSDTAGFKIRNYIKNQLPPDKVRHAYIPNIPGKEKRKIKPGKEGFLGVEGVKDDIIADALKASGCEIDGCAEIRPKGRGVSKADLYKTGFSGSEKSSVLRKMLAEELHLPANINANMLLDVVNRLLSYDEFIYLAEKVIQKYEENNP